MDSFIVASALEHVVRDFLAINFDPRRQSPCEVGISALELPLVQPILAVFQLSFSTVLDGLLYLLQADLFGDFSLLALGPLVSGIGEGFFEVVDPRDACHPVLFFDECLVSLGDIELLHFFAGDDSL